MNDKSALDEAKAASSSKPSSTTADAMEWALHPAHGGPKPASIKVKL